MSDFVCCNLMHLTCLRLETASLPAAEAPLIKRGRRLSLTSIDHCHVVPGLSLKTVFVLKCNLSEASGNRFPSKYSKLPFGLGQRRNLGLHFVPVGVVNHLLYGVSLLLGHQLTPAALFAMLAKLIVTVGILQASLT